MSTRPFTMLRPARAVRRLVVVLAGLWLAQSLMPASSVAQPALRFSTYAGGQAADFSTAIAVDTAGYVYIAGHTLSADLPLRTPAQTYQGGLWAGADAFVAKYSPGGDSLIYATYLGGRLGEEVVTDLVVDAAGRAYVAGSTTAPDFPAPGTVHAFRGGRPLRTDAFVARLSADGARVEAATYLGGRGDEAATGLALGPSGHVYVTGTTTSTDFPVTPGAFQPRRAGASEQPRTDGFAARLRVENGAFTLGYATYLGGGRDDLPHAVVADASGHAWIAGLTTSADFPLQDALQPAYAGPIRALEGDAFVARLSPDGTALDFATYLGGQQDDQASGLVLDAEGHVIVTGATMSVDFPTTPAAYQRERQSLRERFVARFMPTEAGWRLRAVTRLGALGGYETGRAGVAVDRAGRIWLGGSTPSGQFATRQPLQPAYAGGHSDAFLARFDASGRRLDFATYLGGREADVVTDVALGPDGLCATGATASPNFPLQAAYQPQFDGPPHSGPALTSAFVTCFDVRNEAAVLAQLVVSPDTVSVPAGGTVQFSADGYDQFGQALPVTPQWTATGGTVDASGRFTAGAAAGTYAVTARDPATSVAGQARVRITAADDAPAAFALYPNYPNPFRGRTTIRFDVKETTRVVLRVYDVLGRRQATLVDELRAPGRYEVQHDGRRWASGVYFYVIEMGSFRDVKQMVLVR